MENTPTSSYAPSADIVTLERLAARLKEDIKAGFHGLSPAAMASVADIIERSIGAPINWPARLDGANYAQKYYSGSPSSRMAFNHGVKWAVEQYRPSDPD